VSHFKAYYSAFSCLSTRWHGRQPEDSGIDHYAFTVAKLRWSMYGEWTEPIDNPQRRREETMYLQSLQEPINFKILKEKSVDDA